MAVDSVQETHRPGALKQQNKAHKHGRHRSKSSINRSVRGKVSAKISSKKVSRELRRQERRNQAQQIRKKKRDDVLMKKRAVGGSDSPPFLVAVVPLCADIDPLGALEVIKQADDDAVITHGSEGNVHICVPRFKQKFEAVVPKPGSLYDVLDLMKVVDSVVFLISALHENGIDTDGEKILIAVMAQGLPSTIFAVPDLQALLPKHRHDGKQRLQKAVNKWLPDEKVLSLEKSSDGLVLLHRIGSQKLRPVSFRDRRFHMLAEAVDFEPAQEGLFGTLKVSGYARGRPLSVNSLIHISGWGDFQMSQIDASSDPHPLIKSGDKRGDETMGEIRVIEKSDPLKQESLQSENIPDPMEGEQTWPTAEELQNAEEERKTQKKFKKVPKGTSEYQAAWIIDEDVEGGSEEDKYDSDDDDDNEPSMCVDTPVSEEDSADENEDEGDDYETITITEGGADATRYDDKMDLTEEENTLKKIKEAHMDSMFPDEVDTPLDIPARVRFQKYRGLQSFRASPWDPKENLPEDYARIFQFGNFERTKKRVQKETSSNNETGVQPGWYVTIHITNVPQHLVNSRRPGHQLVLYGLLPHEQKMSLLNVVLKRVSPSIVSNQEPIKSKEQLIFHCGYRRFKACPIFSQHTNGNKHKYERYFQPESTVVASMFAPIMFPPCPVLVYKERKDGIQELVATGTVLSANPDRIVAKRVVLSGHPMKVHKRSAVIRFMFFNPEDIAWFKPIELRTKYGRHGHIKESLGTHGHMKCVFNGQLKSQDTVLMNLYKRVFPKWTYEPYVNVSPNLHEEEVEKME